MGSVVLTVKKRVDKVLVIDDGLTDASAEVAGAAGAIVFRHDCASNAADVAPGWDAAGQGLSLQLLPALPARFSDHSPFECSLKDVSRVTKTFSAAMSARQPLKLVQMSNLRKDGRLVTLETTAVPIVDGQGRFSGYQGIHRDITGREQTDQRFAQDLVKLEKTVDGILQALTLMVEMRDPHTAGHQKRVAQLGSAIVKEMPNARARIPELDKTIRMAGLLHDLGKVFIPIEILTKPDQLTPDEFATVKNHPRAGYEVLKSIEFPWPIADVALQHHERLNGSGYPSGLKGDDIRIEARILAVADVVEAMVYPRSYRPALGLDNALREIAKSKGTLYDMEVVEACLSAFLDRGFKFQTE